MWSVMQQSFSLGREPLPEGWEYSGDPSSRADLMVAQEAAQAAYIAEKTKASVPLPPPQSSPGMAEFLDDIKRFKYVKRLLGKYHSGKELKERLILNHIIVLNNLFGVEAATKMLFFKIDKKFWPQLKTFLVFLNYMPEKIILNKGVSIIESEIPVDDKIVEILKRV